MSILSEMTFNAEAIRDTNAHNGTVVFNGDYTVKTLIIENSLNQAVTLQCQASSGSDGYQTCESYFPYWRIVAQCGTSPTSGTLTIHLLGVLI